MTEMRMIMLVIALYFFCVGSVSLLFWGEVMLLLTWAIWGIFLDFYYYNIVCPFELLVCSRYLLIQRLPIRSIYRSCQYLVLQTASVVSVILISVPFYCLIHVAFSLCILQFSHIFHQKSSTFWILGCHLCLLYFISVPYNPWHLVWSYSFSRRICFFFL